MIYIKQLKLKIVINRSITTMQHNITPHPNDNRRMIYPITDSRMKIWDLYVLGRKYHWDPEELKYNIDYTHKAKLVTENQLHTIITPITFFLESDIIVIEDGISAVEDAYKNIPEIATFYDWKKSNERLHAITYNDMFNTLFPNDEERARYLKQMRESSPIVEKFAWLKKTMGSVETIEEAHVVNICTEGIHFASAFKMFDTLQTTPINGEYLFPNICRGNEFIRRDEAIHSDGEIEIYKLSTKKPDVDVVYKIFESAIDLECNFADYMIPEPFGMINRNNMEDHVKANANSLLIKLGLDPLNEVELKDGLHHHTSVTQKSNFFELPAVTEYVRGCSSDFAFFNNDEEC
jgi:ribonucleotide reductase beta subunit family protein with ferritin-like domain